MLGLFGEIRSSTHAFGRLSNTRVRLSGLAGGPALLSRYAMKILSQTSASLTVLSNCMGNALASTPSVLISFGEACCTHRAVEHARVLQWRHASRFSFGVLGHQPSLMNEPYTTVTLTADFELLGEPLMASVWALRGALNSGAPCPFLDLCYVEWLVRHNGVAAAGRNMAWPVPV